MNLAMRLTSLFAVTALFALGACGAEADSTELMQEGSALGTDVPAEVGEELLVSEAVVRETADGFAVTGTAQGQPIELTADLESDLGDLEAPQSLDEGDVLKERVIVVMCLECTNCVSTTTGERCRCRRVPC